MLSGAAEDRRKHSSAGGMWIVVIRKAPARTQAFKVSGKPVDMLRLGLENADIKCVDNGGGYCDFYSLRHTIGNLLAASSFYLKIAQEVIRRGDINLTMNPYTHTLRGQEVNEGNKLPDFPTPGRER